MKINYFKVLIHNNPRLIQAIGHKDHRLKVVAMAVEAVQVTAARYQQIVVMVGLRLPPEVAEDIRQLLSR
jgi:hypothetical protein